VSHWRAADLNAGPRMGVYAARRLAERSFPLSR
jgi:hypothetical protein